jgi:AraC-like DNA-binding protein
MEIPCTALTPLAAVLLASDATVAQQSYRLHAVSCDLPLLIVPLSGTKQLHTAGKSWACRPGQFLMMHRAMQADIENIPDAHAAYRAWVLPFSWAVVELARKLLPSEPLPASDADPVSVDDLALLGDALLAYAADAETTDATLRDYRLLGVLLALHRAGHGQFLQAQDPALSARIRLAVAADPAFDWQSARFETMFGLSGATLRRRLSAEGTTLRAVLQDARLHAGLLRLQNSRKPVKAVALDVGYRSVATFRRNFVERFGLDPAQVANA